MDGERPEPAPFLRRRELRLAIVPPVVAAVAVANLSWAVMFEPSWVPSWWIGVGVGSTVSAGLGLFATALAMRGVEVEYTVAQQLDVGEAASAVLDPEGRTHPDFDGVNWAAGPLWAAANRR